MFKAMFLVFALLKNVETARILGVFPMPGMSHYILTSKLMKGLAEAGHDITMVSPVPLKDPPKNGRFTNVVLDGFADEYDEDAEDFNPFVRDSAGILKQIMSLSDMITTVVNKSMTHPKLRELAGSGQTFDAVLMEQFTMDAHKVYAHIFRGPLIVLSSLGPTGWVNSLVGNPQPISYVAHLWAGDFSNNLSIWNRAKNLMLYVIESLIRKFYILPKQNDLMHSFYPDAPPLEDLYYNVSLVLLNSHTSLYPPSPLVPNMVEIGGYFIDPPQKLPQDLQEFMDNATEGVVYFSMGSILKSKNMPEEKKRIFLKVLGSLNEKVLWKFEEDLPEKPENIMIRKWFPQQDILGHPNMKLFITHGGLLGITEAVYHGLPILAIPVCNDQPANADRAEANGYGLQLRYYDSDFSEEKLRALVNELLTNPKYKETAKKKAILYHDRPLKPMETAVYWVEYVIRHKGATHLRVAGLTLPWYKYCMLDVLITILILFILVLYILLSVTKLFFRRTKMSRKLKQN